MDDVEYSHGAVQMCNLHVQSVDPGEERCGCGCECVCVCVCESYIGKPIGTRAVPQFTTGVAKPLTQIEPGKN